MADTIPAPDDIEERIERALDDDLIRIVRKDMTVTTEMLAKYRQYRARANGQLADELKDVEVVLMNLRDALDDIIGVLPSGGSGG